MTSFAEAREHEKAARQALTDARKALDEAEKALRAIHRPIIQQLNDELIAAKSRALAAQSAETPDHQWEGQIVEGPEYDWKRHSETVRGVVFTYRPGVHIGRGHTYSRPEVGDPFVRILKKDGTPGARTVTLSSKFKLVSA